MNTPAAAKLAKPAASTKPAKPAAPAKLAKPAKPARLGLVVLQSDETLEYESRLYLQHTDARLLVSRIPVNDRINRATLRAMRARLQQSLAVFPARYHFDAVAYACTSAAAVIGEAACNADLKNGCRARRATNPLSAAKAALRHLGAKRIAYLSPYVPQVAAVMCENLTRAGFQIQAQKNFGIASDRAVAAIPAAKILTAALAVAASTAPLPNTPGNPPSVNRGQPDALFLSCTNLNCASIIAKAEEALGIPVISSNQALLWHLLQLAKIPRPQNPTLGRLFSA